MKTGAKELIEVLKKELLRKEKKVMQLLTHIRDIKRDLLRLGVELPLPESHRIQTKEEHK